MKIRNGFVTNSSSSSFVLAFKDDNDFNKFEKYCDMYRYGKVFKLIKSYKNDTNIDNKDFKEALHLLKFVHSYNKLIELDKAFEEKYEKEHEGGKYSYNDLYIARAKYEDTDEYKNAIQEYLDNDSKYQERLNRLMNSKSFAYGTIWDSDGGLLEWAIRNELLKREFYEWTLVDWQVG